jgi:hypothetical protein
MPIEEAAARAFRHCDKDACASRPKALPRNIFGLIHEPPIGQICRVAPFAVLVETIQAVVSTLDEA